MFTNLLSNGMGHVHFTLLLSKDSETSMCLNPVHAYHDPWPKHLILPHEYKEWIVRRPTLKCLLSSRK